MGDKTNPSSASQSPISYSIPSPNLSHQLPVKLTSTTFLLWKTQFIPMVCDCGLNHHIDGSEPVPDTLLEDSKPNPTYKVWVREDQLVLSWIVASVSEGSKPLIRELKMQLHTLRRDNASIKSYIQKAKGIADRLAALQHPISNDDLVEFVLAGLGPVYRPFTRSVEPHQEDITFDALYGLLLNEEQQLKRD
ncbi:PREDICTED: uncharacterized protein LOC109231585 [Nicotiana attenuata]|uniref:uncharacterized protein LOC109231585 n=1 Tax=Nicotiana attenuata TaxID=49451 RepID=UPI000904EF58|nr:PREDICTED: uncharacterized protein LOC109231585 [Nicotiana attenuata]